MYTLSFQLQRVVYICVCKWVRACVRSVVRECVCFLFFVSFVSFIIKPLWWLCFSCAVVRFFLQMFVLISFDTTLKNGYIQAETIDLYDCVDLRFSLTVSACVSACVCAYACVRARCTVCVRACERACVCVCVCVYVCVYENIVMFDAICLMFYDLYCNV